jgi:isopentenyl-diphosphate delta-isomerase
MKEYVILVDPTDQPVGRMEKMEAHEKGILHRAFSVFLFNEKGETLLQQRASTKYHSPLLWTNTCCSHQRDGESNAQAASRRLREELGIELAPDRLNDVFSFVYRAEFDNGLTEHELDHVLVGSLPTYSAGWRR